MGKGCCLLAITIISLALIQTGQSASLENPLVKSIDGHDDGGLQPGMDYDYGFLNRPSPDFGGFPWKFGQKTMRRHGRSIRRTRRAIRGGNYVNGQQAPDAPAKIPAGCCNCGDHYCCDGMCHGK